MGLLTGIGSGSRCLAPIFVSNIYVYFGPRIAFASIGGILLINSVFVLVLYRRLVPYQSKELNDCDGVNCTNKNIL